MLTKHEFIQQAAIEIYTASMSEPRKSYPTPKESVVAAENLWEALEERGYSQAYKKESN